MTGPRPVMPGWLTGLMVLVLALALLLLAEATIPPWSAD